MTTAADDAALEDAFEAFLAGRSVPDEAAGTAAFAEAVRSTATRPGRPNAALADLLATGLLTDQSSPPVRTAPSAGRPRAFRGRIRRRTAMFLPALVAKIAGAGAVAKAAAGAGVVLVAFTGAGSAGVLPDSLQHSFATVAGTVGLTVEDPPAPAGRQGTTTGEPTGEPTGGTSDGTSDGVADQSEPADGDATPEPAGEAPQGGDRSDREGAGLACDGYDTFGACVSDAARAGGVDGQDVSRAAQERNDARREERGRATTAPSRAGAGRAADAEQQDEQEAEQDAGQEDDRSDRAGQTDDSSDAPAIRGKGGDDSAQRRGRSDQDR